MKIKPILLSTLLLFAFSLLQAQKVQYKIGDETKITISGTSTLHDWNSDVTKYEGNAELDKQLVNDAEIKKGDKIGDLNLQIAVEGIISGRGETMDSRTFAALKSKEHPNIIFTLTHNDIENVNGSKFTLKAKGKLEIAGKSREIELTVEGERVSAQQFKFNGSYKLNMKDYGVEPPTAMFGQIVCGDEVEIKFDLELVKA